LYKGGDFILYEGEKLTLLPKEHGKLIAFPSYTLHEVKPVTKGERYSLVAWITGPQFK
jgi:predicted 2-oxoglutarate/Fe(II)-dependent dioxygenase YbiX